MCSNNLYKLLGRSKKELQSKDALLLGSISLQKIIEFFKNRSFGVITLQGIDIPKSKSQKIEVRKLKLELQRLKLNYIKFLGRWLIDFKETINTKEISFFILLPNFKTMIKLTKEFNQGTFIFSENGEHNLYYADGYKIMLEKDTNFYGNLIEAALLLKCKDFKFVYDSIVDFQFNFKDPNELKIGDEILLEQKYSSELEFVIVNDIRQNAIIHFEREHEFNTIKPKVYQLDEIKYLLLIEEISSIEEPFAFGKVS